MTVNSPFIPISYEDPQNIWDIIEKILTRINNFQITLTRNIKLENLLINSSVTGSGPTATVVPTTTTSKDFTRPSTVTKGKGANFMGTKCTTGKGANFMGTKCTPGKGANFMVTKCTTKDTGTVGPSTVTEEKKIKKFIKCKYININNKNTSGNNINNINNNVNGNEVELLTEKPYLYIYLMKNIENEITNEEFNKFLYERLNNKFNEEFLIIILMENINNKFYNKIKNQLHKLHLHNRIIKLFLTSQGEIKEDENIILLEKLIKKYIIININKRYLYLLINLIKPITGSSVTVSNSTEENKIAAPNVLTSTTNSTPRKGANSTATKCTTTTEENLSNEIAVVTKTGESGTFSEDITSKDIKVSEDTNTRGLSTVTEETGTVGPSTVTDTVMEKKIFDYIKLYEDWLNIFYKLKLLMDYLIFYEILFYNPIFSSVTSVTGSGPTATTTNEDTTVGPVTKDINTLTNITTTVPITVTEENSTTILAAPNVPTVTKDIDTVILRINTIIDNIINNNSIKNLTNYEIKKFILYKQLLIIKYNLNNKIIYLITLFLFNFIFFLLNNFIPNNFILNFITNFIPTIAHVPTVPTVTTVTSVPNNIQLNGINDIVLDNLNNNNIIIILFEIIIFINHYINSSVTVTGPPNSTTTTGKRANNTFSTMGKRANNTFSTLGKGANSMCMKCTSEKNPNKIAAPKGAIVTDDNVVDELDTVTDNILILNILKQYNIYTHTSNKDTIGTKDTIGNGIKGARDTTTTGTTGMEEDKYIINTYKYISFIYLLLYKFLSYNNIITSITGSGLTDTEDTEDTTDTEDTELDSIVEPDTVTEEKIPNKIAVVTNFGESSTFLDTVTNTKESPFGAGTEETEETPFEVDEDTEDDIKEDEFINYINNIYNIIIQLSFNIQFLQSNTPVTVTGPPNSTTTLGASTVTEEKNLNEIAVVTNSRESSTFSVDTNSKVTEDIKEAPFGAVGEEVGCLEPHSVMEEIIKLEKKLYLELNNINNYKNNIINNCIKYFILSNLINYKDLFLNFTYIDSNYLYNSFYYKFITSITVSGTTGTEGTVRDTNSTEEPDITEENSTTQFAAKGSTSEDTKGSTTKDSDVITTVGASTVMEDNTTEFEDNISISTSDTIEDTIDTINTSGSEEKNINEIAIVTKSGESGTFSLDSMDTNTVDTTESTNIKVAPFGAVDVGTGAVGASTVTEDTVMEELDKLDEIGIDMKIYNCDEYEHIFNKKNYNINNEEIILHKFCKNFLHILFIKSSNTVLAPTGTVVPGTINTEVTGTTGASTVTKGKGANFTAMECTMGKGANSMGMECTSEKTSNEIAVVTKTGESGTFSEGVSVTEGITSKDIKATGTGAVGPVTVTGDIVKELLMKIILKGIIIKEIIIINIDNKIKEINIPIKKNNLDNENLNNLFINEIKLPKFKNKLLLCLYIISNDINYNNIKLFNIQLFQQNKLNNQKNKLINQKNEKINENEKNEEMLELLEILEKNVVNEKYEKLYKKNYEIILTEIFDVELFDEIINLCINFKHLIKINKILVNNKILSTNNLLLNFNSSYKINIHQIIKLLDTSVTVTGPPNSNRPEVTTDNLTTRDTETITGPQNSTTKNPTGPSTVTEDNTTTHFAPGKGANFTLMECTPGKGANSTAMECTPGKGANSTAMECTSEKIPNEIAVVTKTGESDTFSKREEVGERVITDGLSEAVVGPDTVTEDPDSEEKIEIKVYYKMYRKFKSSLEELSEELIYKIYLNRINNTFTISRNYNSGTNLYISNSIKHFINNIKIIKPVTVLGPTDTIYPLNRAVTKDTIGASTVTKGKRANFMPIECTKGNIGTSINSIKDIKGIKGIIENNNIRMEYIMNIPYYGYINKYMKINIRIRLNKDMKISYKIEKNENWLIEGLILNNIKLSKNTFFNINFILIPIKLGHLYLPNINFNLNLNLPKHQITIFPQHSLI